jgi:hypothetical protein
MLRYIALNLSLVPLHPNQDYCIVSLVAEFFVYGVRVWLNKNLVDELGISRLIVCVVELRGCEPFWAELLECVQHLILLPVLLCMGFWLLECVVG